MSDIILSLLQKGEEQLWIDFLKESINYTFYQELGFLDYYAYKVHKVKKIVFKKNNKIIALLPAGIVENNDRFELRSPYSASFGGFCYSPGLKLEDAFQILKLFIEYCESENISKIIIQQPPQIYYRDVNEYFDFVLNYYSFRIDKCDLTLYVKCTNDFIENISATARNIIRRSIKEKIKFELTDKISEVFNLIENNKEKKGLTMTVSNKELLDLKKRFPDDINFFVVKSGEEIICSSVIYSLNPKVMLVMFWAQKEGWEKKSPTYYLIYNLIQYGFTRGYQYLDFGTTTIDGEPVWGITNFKEKFHPNGALRKKYLLILK